MGRSTRHVTPPKKLKDLPEEELLGMRVRDLHLHVEGSPLERRVGRLYAELDAHGIGFHPPCYLADEWLCPDKVPVIGIPFYLAHGRLARLEKKMMLEVEGGTESACMRLLRHEAGHAINYAYRLFRRTRWRELFGPFSQKYCESYYAKPYSKRYVNHLPGNYAQAHPDEDFAETFAVWLTPGSDWQARYVGWPAMNKLQYVDRVMRRIASQPPLVTDGPTPWSASRMTSTLATYYRRKRESLGAEFPGFYDPGLQRLFTTQPGAESTERAGDLLRRWRKHIVNSVARWTGQKRLETDRLVGKLIRRCDALELRTHASEVETVTEVTSFVTAVMNNVHLFLEPRSKK